VGFFFVFFLLTLGFFLEGGLSNGLATAFSVARFTGFLMYFLGSGVFPILERSPYLIFNYKFNLIKMKYYRKKYYKNKKMPFWSNLTKKEKTLNNWKKRGLKYTNLDKLYEEGLTKTHC